MMVDASDDQGNGGSAPANPAEAAREALLPIVLDGDGSLGVGLYDRTGGAVRTLDTCFREIDGPSERRTGRPSLSDVEAGGVRRWSGTCGDGLLVSAGSGGVLEVLADDRFDAVPEGAVRSIASVAYEAARSRDRLADAHDRIERLEAELTTAEANNEQLSEFTSIVSHDLRNPLSVAQGSLELAEETGEQEYFDRLESALERIDRIVEHTLTLVREDDTVLDSEPVDLATATERSWDLVATADATITVEGTATIVADSSLLDRVLENLFRNAVEHAGEDVAVRVGPLPDGFFVADDGPGIPPSERDRVFERGYSTETNGIGIGLAIVRDVVQSHGWQIDITESRSGGARFEITGVERHD